MFKVSHSMLVFLSGLIWLGVGCFLLPLGVNFVVEAMLKENFATLPHPIFSLLAPYVGGIDPAAVLLVACALLVGFVKGRFLFPKTIQRSVNRILALPNPARLSKIYSWRYYLLLGVMAGLGVMTRYLPLDIRGGIDIAVGTALIIGAMFYFRQAWAIRPRLERIYGQQPQV